MITIDNYFDEIKKVDFSTFSAPIRQARDFVWRITNEGKSWEAYHSSEKIKKTVDLYLAQLNVPYKNVKNKKSQISTTTNIEKDNKKKKTAPVQIIREVQKDSDDEPVMVSRIPEEIRFIRRFVNLNGKVQTKDQLLRFINTLQKAIVEKRIRKTSQWAEQITDIQNRMIKTFNNMEAPITFTLKSDTLESLKRFVVAEKLLPSVNFIKRYIGLHEKTGIKDKAKALLTHIDKAYDKGAINDNDPYIMEIQGIKKNLHAFVADKPEKKLKIENVTLHGLQNILNGLGSCSCQSLNGLSELPVIMNSMDFADMQFDSIGLDGKWGEFIGDPSPGFSAMLSGRPKYGKSTLCVGFAGHLARKHGHVLFVAKEEGFSRTLRDKLVAVKHPRLTVASVLPANLTSYEYVFLDSVTRMGLTPDDLRRLKTANPGISFIYVFQVTKDGKFRGVNDFQHDVDIVIEVPEKGKAIQYGRYNQGGEMNIFETNEYQNAA